MTKRELAAWLCANVSQRRLVRAGMEPRTPTPVENPFDTLSLDEQANWLDMADAVLELEGSGHPIERLTELGRDWARYSMQIAEASWRHEMLRAVIVEMRAEVDKLAEQCDG